MTKQDKELLLKDLCARLPYGVICNCINPKFSDSVDWTLFKINLQDGTIETTNNEWNDEFAIENIKPYLRPMSSMTKKEFSEIKKLFGFEITTSLGKTYIDNWKQGLNEINYNIDLFDYFNTHYLDFRNLIPIGLALPAPDGMYDFK